MLMIPPLGICFRPPEADAFWAAEFLTAPGGMEYGAEKGEGPWRKGKKIKRIGKEMSGDNTEKQGLEGCSCGIREKQTPRGAEELKQLKNRISRMVGQLNGIGKMLDENRYCGDILNQIAAVESALQSFGHIVLRNHMETCVAEELKKGNMSVIEETVELVRKLK